MATQQIRFWSDPNRNKTITVTYVDAPDRRVYFEVAPIDPDQNMAGGGLPQDGFVAGEVLTSFCEGPDLVSFRASNVQPYALIDVTPDSPTCQGSTPAVKLSLDSLTSTDETAAGNDGTATIQASGGTAPLTASVVELLQEQPATSVQPVTFSGLPASQYTVRVQDANGQQVSGKVTIGAYVAPVAGCQDEYATNYVPAASSPVACSYAPTWRSAWQAMAVSVAPLPAAMLGYVEANLRIGFRTGHPLTAIRPVGLPIRIRAAVAPDGLATFRLGPYLRAQLGASDGGGGYRLDLNSPTALTSDLFVGYELRRPTGEMLEHGYALNAAVADGDLFTGQELSPFGGRFPTWFGFAFPVSVLGAASAGQYGIVQQVVRLDLDMPCPLNPVPVAWLAPGGGFGYWVFQGRPVLGDEVGESQAYTEALTNERRFSQRGDTRRTVSATSGVFASADLLEGLRTLPGSPQVWYKRELAGPWIPVTLDGSSFPAGRLGVRRQEVRISFTEAAPRNAQGQ